MPPCRRRQRRGLCRAQFATSARFEAQRLEQARPPAQDPPRPPKGRPNADLSGQGKTKKLEKGQRRKRKTDSRPIDAALRNPNKLTRKRIRRQPPGERSYQTKGNIPPHLGEIIQTCATDWRQKNAQAAEKHKKTNMIGHARRGPGMDVDIQIETFILLFAQNQAKNAGSQSRGAANIASKQIMFRITGKLDPAQFQARFFRSGQWRAGERRAPAVISLIPIHLPSHSSHSFRSTPRPFRAAPAYSSPGPLRLPKPRRRRLSPPFPPLRPLGATKKPAGGACGLFSSFRAAA